MKPVFPQTPPLRPGDPVRYQREVLTLERVLGPTALLKGAGGVTRYVQLADVTPALPDGCSVAEALAFVERAKVECANEGGRVTAAPLRVLLALADAIPEEVRRAG